jgi:hypothetical protein
MTFQELVEVVYKKGIPYHKLNPNLIATITDLSDKTAIYKGKKYNLHMVKIKNRNYFAITLKDNVMIFFQQFEKIEGYLKVKLKARMNTASVPLFNLLIGTLLYLGVIVVDDDTHNDNSIKSIRRMLTSGDIVCFINDRQVSVKEWEESIKTDSSDVFEYRSAEHGNIPILESHHYMCDAFEMGEVYAEIYEETK